MAYDRHAFARRFRRGPGEEEAECEGGGRGSLGALTMARRAYPRTSGCVTSSLQNKRDSPFFFFVSKV